MNTRPAVLLLSVGVAACSVSSPTSPRGAAGPDAALSAEPAATGPLRVIVQRPIRDRSGSGVPSVDDRTLVAVLQPDRAVWLASARLDTDAALSLAAAMAASLREAPPAAKSDVTLSVASSMLPPEVSGRRVIDGGRWRWIGRTGTGPATRCHMSLDDADGRTLARLTMDTAAARALMQSLNLTIRTSPARLTGAAVMEHEP